jgi:energy-coupling factor transporter ATP-binding protein EcfA2
VAEADSALQATGLGYRFPDGAWAFRGIDLELRSGELCLLAGRNGSGKSFLAKHLAGLMEPTEGSVLVQGKRLGTLEGGPATRVGYVFQDAALQTVGETVLDDALFGPTCLGLSATEARSRADAALAACWLTSLSDAFVHGLSGGEARRLAIAGVLAMSPAVLILDEPFANLDPEGVGAIVRLIRDLKDSGLAVLVVTHEIEKILGMASFFAIMEKGRIVLSGEPAAVLESGIESYGLRDPLRAGRGKGLCIEDLLWL